MAESFLSLPRADRTEALEVAAARSGRPAYLLEKDCWVVWALQMLFESAAGSDLVFKGGTSLSKVHGAIDRFSEDVDLTCNIRALLGGDLNGQEPDPIPGTRSQGDKWVRRIGRLLPEWIESEVVPTLAGAAPELGGGTTVVHQTPGVVELRFGSVLASGSQYVAPVVRLEFGARSTGEPAEVHVVTCDAARSLSELMFPVASPRTMAIERTFWEKATLAHVICSGGRWRGGDRLSRHWFDLAALARHSSVEGALRDRELASAVARHKASFFRETNPDGQVIDYAAAVNGGLRLVPAGERYRELEEDYSRMTEAGLLPEGASRFDDIIDACGSLARHANDMAG